MRSQYVLMKPKKLVGGLVTVFTAAEPPRRQSFSMLAEWQPSFPPSRPEIRVLLQLPEEAISSRTRAALELVDGDSCPDEVLSLLRGVRAYFELQDVLTGRIASFEGKPIFEIDHCYYESIVYLRESLMAWIQGQELAAMALLRPFLELSLLHLYWELRPASDSFEHFFKWLDGGPNKPGFKQIRDAVIQNLPTQALLDFQDLERMSDFLGRSFAVLCSYNHTPKPEQSVFMRDEFLSETQSYVTITEALLRHLVFLYAFAYPAAFYPVDRMRKWGYSYGPVGIFADQSTANIIHDFLGESYPKLTVRFSSLQRIADEAFFYECQPDLSDEEIEASWHSLSELDVKTKSVQDTNARQAMVKAHLRSIGWMMNYSSVNSKPDADLDDIINRARSSLTHLKFLSDPETAA